MWTYFVLLLGLACASAYERATVTKCLWHNNVCVDSCPDWMVETVSNCSLTYWPAQRTCSNPQRTLVGTVCGFSRCDCPGETALDVDTGYCYDVDNCPTKHDLSYS